MECLLSYLLKFTGIYPFLIVKASDSRNITFFLFLKVECLRYHSVNGTGAVCAQTSKVLVSHREESIAGHLGITGVY
jgi:hypothetical protein